MIKDLPNNDEILIKWLKICQIMMKYWLGFGEKLRSGGILGGPGGLSEAILNDNGSKLACLGSCWCHVAHFGQQDGCQDGHLGYQECQDEPRWGPRAAKVS